jgi:hypothetical protein
MHGPMPWGRRWWLVDVRRHPLYLVPPSSSPCHCHAPPPATSDSAVIRYPTLTDRRIGKKLIHSSVRRKSMLHRQLRRHPRAITLTDRRIGQNLFNEISCPSSNSELGNDFNEFSVHRQTRSSELGNENETMAAGCLSETYHRSTSNDIPSAGGRHITNYCV